MYENVVEVKPLILPGMVGRSFMDQMAFKLGHKQDLSRYSEKVGKGRSLLSRGNERYRHSLMSTWVFGKFGGASIRCGDRAAGCKDVCCQITKAL